MPDLVQERLLLLIERENLDPARTAAVLLGHGSRRNARSRASTEAMADHVRRSRRFGDVLVAFLDEDPTVESIPARTTLPHVLVLPFLIGGGPHVTADIPQRLEAAWRSRRPGSVNRSCTIDVPIGAVVDLRTIIRELALEGWRLLDRSAAKATGGAHAGGRAAGGRSQNGGPAVPSLRLGTRSSALALWQARYVERELADRGIRVELVEMSTSGDRRLDCAIADLPSDAPFTDDLDAALRCGEIDLAVHALKDLPVPLPDDLGLAAVLPRGEVTEALVSRERRRLGELPAGSVVGTSSPRRAAQLLALRPDVIPATIRGAVDDRVRQLRRGDFDAVILATAGLRRLGLTGEIAEILSPDDFLPAPGQGALVVQIRRDDHGLREQLALLDHTPTRRAVRAELELFRHFQDDPRWTLSTWADACPDGRITLRARLLVCDGTLQFDACREGHDPMLLAMDVARYLRNQSLCATRPMKSLA